MEVGYMWSNAAGRGVFLSSQNQTEASINNHPLLSNWCMVVISFHTAWDKTTDITYNQDMLYAGNCNHWILCQTSLLH